MVEGLKKIQKGKFVESQTKIPLKELKKVPEILDVEKTKPEPKQKTAVNQEQTIPADTLLMLIADDVNALGERLRKFHPMNTVEMDQCLLRLQESFMWYKNSIEKVTQAGAMKTAEK